MHLTLFHTSKDLCGGWSDGSAVKGHLLLSQRTQVWFPPANGLQFQLCLQVQSRGPDALLWYQVHMRGTDIYIGKTPIQNKVFFKKRKKKILCDAKSLEAKDEDEKG